MARRALAYHPRLLRPEPITELIRERLDCREVAQRYGLRFKRQQGPWWVCSCFNHSAHARGDRNPSCSMSQERFKCFSASCGISGDVFTLIAAMEELDAKTQFRQVLQIAAELAGVELPPTPIIAGAWTKPSMTSQVARAQLGPQLSPQRRAGASASASAEAWTRSSGVERGRRPQAYALAPHGEEFARHFQRPWPLQLPADHPRLALMEQIWSLVRQAPLGPDALEWLERRAIDPALAYAYGCRDFAACRHELLALLDESPEVALQDAGLVRLQDGQRVEWLALRALRGERWARGLAIPQVHPGWVRAPLAWRWRLCEPYTMRTGKTLKAVAQYSGQPPVPALALGAAPPSAASLAGLARWPELAQDPERPEYILVLCEGEPDFLSIAQVSASLETARYVVPLGLVAMSSRLGSESLDLLHEAQKIVCVVDEGRMFQGRTGGQRVIDQVRGALLEQRRRARIPFDVAYDQVNARLIGAMRRDDDDVNDLHRRGQLRPWLEGLLADAL